jgi:hypothetical protein
MLLTGCRGKNNEKQVSEKLTLSGYDKSPMGGYVFKWLAKKSFSIEDFNYNNKAFDGWYKNYIAENYHSTNSVYFILAPRVIAYREEAMALEEYVDNGNTLFIAANYIDPFLLEQFHVTIEDDISDMPAASGFGMRNTQKQLTDSALFKPNTFSFFFYPLQKTIVADSSEIYEVLGLNDLKEPDLIRIVHGKGQLVIMTNAQACTNYFLLTKNNIEYALGAFSYLPIKSSNIYWDDFYRKNSTRSPQSKSVFSALLSILPLRFSFFILLAMAALWIITNLFRKQKIIPVLQPSTNSSREFTQTIARLYYNKKDNRNIALKIIAYLQDHLRNKYYINYTGINEDFANILAAKTGLTPEKTNALVQTIYTVQHNVSIDDATLLTLNAQVQEVMNT